MPTSCGLHHFSLSFWLTDCPGVHLMVVVVVVTIMEEREREERG